jgi:UDP-N-acetylmuramate dehydrogenase
METHSVMKETRQEIIALLEGCSAEVRWNEPMAPYTTIKIGGAAMAMVFPRAIEEVAGLMQRLSVAQISFLILGAGSNLLVPDDGIEGVVIHLKDLDQVILTGDDTFYVEAGFSYPKLSTYAEKQGLSGIEFAAGIPGTVGGVVAMNAGIPGEETASVVRNVTHVSLTGEVQTFSNAECGFSYRATGLPPGVIVAVEMVLKRAPVREIENKRIDLLKKRRNTQPLSYPNVGSIFKNPDHTPISSAGRLIEEARLKGHRIGGAQISEKHGNFIINLGGATAQDVLTLMQLMQERVFLEKGVQLAPEIKWWGAPNPVFNSVLA